MCLSCVKFKDLALNFISSLTRPLEDDIRISIIVCFFIRLFVRSWKILINYYISFSTSI